MKYPPFSAMANVLVRARSRRMRLRMSTELGRHLTPAPENMRIMGPAEAPVPRLKDEYRYQLLIKVRQPQGAERAAADGRRSLRAEQKWSATALVIDVDPLTLM